MMVRLAKARRTAVWYRPGREVFAAKGGFFRVAHAARQRSGPEVPRCETVCAMQPAIEAAWRIYAT